MHLNSQGSNDFKAVLVKLRWLTCLANGKHLELLSLGKEKNLDLLRLGKKKLGIT
jgi:hypothetical protein